jgi:cytochrome c oxidase subunit 2
MEIHRYEKLWFTVSLLLIIGFIATVSFGAAGVGIKMISDDGGTVDPNSLGEHERFGNTGVHHVSGDHYEVNIVAYHPAFVPGQIEIPAGSTVDFYLTSGDVIHGFEIVGTNVNTMIVPGQVSEFTVEFDDPGTYGYICHEYCGPQHHIMEGQLRVVPEDEWEGGA